MSDLAELLTRLSMSSMEDYRKRLRRMGPRHRNVDRWMFGLGWSISEDVLEAYLAPEVIPDCDGGGTITVRRKDRANG